MRFARNFFTVTELAALVVRNADTIMHLGTEGLTRVPRDPNKFATYCKDTLDESMHPAFHQGH